MERASHQRRMLLVLFHSPGGADLGKSLAAEVQSFPQLAAAVERAVRVALPTTAKSPVEGKPVELLKHAAFADLKGGPGLAVVDLAHRDPPRYGHVVAALPAVRGRPWDVAKLAAALEAALELAWMTDYGQAMDRAAAERKMLLLYFCRPGRCELGARFERETLADPEVRAKLAGMVRVRLPLGATIQVEGRPVELLKHEAFAEMEGLPGVAILDFAHKDPKIYGQVVSAFPFFENRPYTVDEMKVILGLPPGTLTQRTLIYAVSMHPERPASVKGRMDSRLLEEAESHSHYQARILRQGHHFWENRFHRINARLPGGCMAYEVCAESWAGQGLLQAALECVRCWRLSSGHWRSVSSPCQAYGYDMKRGANGVWYATGIFGR